MKEIRAYPDHESGLYLLVPAPSFMCSRRSTITRRSMEGIVGGELSNTIAGGIKGLTITWWQSIGDQIYNLTATTTTTELRPINGHPNTYSFTLNMNNDRLNVTAGNVIGIQFDTEIFNLYYDTSRRGIINHRITSFESGSSQINIIEDTSLSDRVTFHGVPLFSSTDRGII